jgi:hypothetical protein
MAGDPLLCRLVEPDQHENLQLASGRPTTLFPGDELVLAAATAAIEIAECDPAEAPREALGSLRPLDREAEAVASARGRRSKSDGRPALPRRAERRGALASTAPAG